MIGVFGAEDRRQIRDVFATKQHSLDGGTRRQPGDANQVRPEHVLRTEPPVGLDDGHRFDAAYGAATALERDAQRPHVESLSSARTIRPDTATPGCVDTTRPSMSLATAGHLGEFDAAVHGGAASDHQPVVRGSTAGMRKRPSASVLKVMRALADHRIPAEQTAGASRRSAARIDHDAGDVGQRGTCDLDVGANGIASGGNGFRCASASLAADG